MYYFTDPPIVQKLHKAIFEIVRDNPTLERGDLLQELLDTVPKLVNEYAEYLFGDDYVEGGLSINDCYDIEANIKDLWEDNYEDERTGIAMSFEEWAAYFAQPNEPEDNGIYPIAKQYEYFANELQKLTNQ